MNSGDIGQILCVLLLVFTVFYLWDTPKKRQPKELNSADIALAIARSKNKLKKEIGK